MEITNHMRTSEAQALAERVHRIRLPIKELARRANVHEGTISPHLAGRSRMSERLERDVVAAVEAEELDLLAHLARRHPQEAARQGGLALADRAADRAA